MSGRQAGPSGIGWLVVALCHTCRHPHPHDSHSHAVRTDTSIGISCTKIWFVLLLRNEAALEALWQDVWRRGS